MYTKKIITAGIAASAMLLAACGGGSGGSGGSGSDTGTDPENPGTNNPGTSPGGSDEPQQGIGAPFESMEPVELVIYPMSISNGQKQLVAVGEAEDGTLMPMTHRVEWATTESDYLAVSKTGRLKFNNASQNAKIRALYNEDIYDIVSYSASTASVNSRTALAEKAATDSAFTIYYKSSNGQPNIYLWIGEGNSKAGEWPGSAMTQYEDNWYSYTVQTSDLDNGNINVVFNWDGGNGQTADTSFSFNGSNGYYDNTWLNSSPFSDNNGNGDNNDNGNGNGNTGGNDNTPTGDTILLKCLSTGMTATYEGESENLCDTEVVINSVLELRAGSAPGGAAFGYWQGNGALFTVDYTLSHTSMVVVRDSSALTISPYFIASDTAGSCDASNPAAVVSQDRNLRLLTKNELENTLSALLGSNLDASVTGLIPASPTNNNYDTSSDVYVNKNRLYGFESAALEVAGMLADQGLDRLADKSCNDACMVEAIGKKIFRRPLDNSEVNRYEELLEEDSSGELMLATMLLSPNFLYRSEVGEQDSSGYYKLTSYEMASLISYTFLASMPDEELMEAADKNELQTPTQVADQVSRLLETDAAKDAFERFASGWLIQDRYGMGGIEDKELAEHLQYETVKFVSELTFENMPFSELLTADYTYANKSVAEHYGLSSVSSDNNWVRRIYKGDNNADRRGVLGHASFLSSRSHGTKSSPIKRGVHVRRQILCQEFTVAVAGIDDKTIDPSDTQADITKKHTEDPGCQACHQFIDGVGFGFELYGGDAQFRSHEETDAGPQEVYAEGAIKSLDSVATVLDANAATYEFDGVESLSDLLLSNDNAALCYSRQFYRYSIGVMESAQSECAIQTMSKKFLSGTHGLKDLMVEYTKTLDFMYRK